MSIGATIKNGEAFRVSDEAGSSVNRDGSRAAVVVAADVAPLSSTNTNIVRSGESVQEDQLAARATSALRRRTGEHIPQCGGHYWHGINRRSTSRRRLSNGRNACGIDAVDFSVFGAFPTFAPRNAVLSRRKRTFGGWVRIIFPSDQPIIFLPVKYPRI